MQNRITRCILAPLLACASFLAATAVAETYKWTDAEGKVHYSDQPPPSSVKNPTTVTPRKKTSRSAPEQESETAKTEGKQAPTAAKTTQELDAEFRQRRVEAAEKEAADRKAAQEAEEKRKNCEQSKANVARLKNGGRIARANDQGETEYLDDAQIEAEIARASQAADSWCK